MNEGDRLDGETAVIEGGEHGAGRGPAQLITRTAAAAAADFDCPTVRARAAVDPGLEPF